MRLPLLMFLEDHNDESVITCIQNHIDELYKLGYRTLCIELPDNKSIDEYISHINITCKNYLEYLMIMFTCITTLNSVNTDIKRSLTAFIKTLDINILIEFRNSKKLLNLYHRNIIAKYDYESVVAYINLQLRKSFFESTKQKCTLITIDSQALREIEHGKVVCTQRDSYMANRIYPLLRDETPLIFIVGFMHFSIINHLKSYTDFLPYIVYHITCLEIQQSYELDMQMALQFVKDTVETKKPEPPFSEAEPNNSIRKAAVSYTRHEISWDNKEIQLKKIIDEIITLALRFLPTIYMLRPLELLEDTPIENKSVAEHITNCCENVALNKSVSRNLRHVLLPPPLALKLPISAPELSANNVNNLNS